MGLKKNSPLIAVRIGVLCSYTFFKNLKFLACPGYQKALHSKVVSSIFFWFLAVICGLPGVRICNGITFKSAFSFPNRTNFLKFCNFLAFQQILLNTPHLGWCSAVNFWRNSTRFAGFLAMIFTSKWLLASRNHWGLRNAKKILQKCLNLEKILEISENFSIIFVVFRISNRSTLKRQSIFNFF